MSLHHTVRGERARHLALTQCSSLHTMKLSRVRWRPVFSMNKQVFYDPQRKRWKRLRRIFDLLALLGLVLGSVFVIGLVRMKPLPELFLQTQKRNYRALANQSLVSFKLRRSAHRRTDVKPGDVPLNSGEGLRAAYYVEDDPASYSSLKQHISQVDLLFPEWLHVI